MELRYLQNPRSAESLLDWEAFPSFSKRPAQASKSSFEISADLIQQQLLH